MNTFDLVVRERFASIRRRCCTLPIGMTPSFKYNYKPFRIGGPCGSRRRSAMTLLKGERNGSQRSRSWDLSNFSGLILMARLRVTPGKSSLLCTKLLSFRRSLHLHPRRPAGCGTAALNLFGTQNTPGSPPTGSKLKLFN